MARYRTRIDGTTIDVYEKVKGKSKKTALVLLGFPATLGETKLTKLLVEQDYCVVVPHYPGTYDSDGEFTPSNSIDMVEHICSGLKSPVVNLKTNSPISISENVELIVGYSFGAFVAVNSLFHVNTIKKALFISPALVYGESVIDMGFTEEGEAFLDYIKRTRPHTYRMGSIDEWHQFYSGQYNEFESIVNTSTSLSILSLIGKEDGSIDFTSYADNSDKFFRYYFNPTLNEIICVDEAGHSLGGIFNKEVIVSKVEDFVS
jgi:esterase/lipase